MQFHAYTSKKKIDDIKEIIRTEYMIQSLIVTIIKHAA